MVRILKTGLAAALAAALAAPALAGDPAHGRTVFNAQCGVCHSANKGGPTILGPNLWGVVGRRAGSVPGFAYSAAMKSAGFTWTDEKLTEYLPAPTKVVPGTKMTYGGLKNPANLADVLAYLDGQK